MQTRLFQILNLMSSASTEEVNIAYNNKKSQLREDMFLEGSAGNNAAKELTALEDAYRDYLDYTKYDSKNDSTTSGGTTVYDDVEAFVKSGKLNEAQSMLDNIQTRDGSWHYFQAMIYYKKDWYTDCKKHLEKAIDLDGNNAKYKETLSKLSTKMSGGRAQPVNGQQVNGQNPNGQNPNGQNPNGQQGEWWKQNDTVDNKGQPDWNENNRQMGGCNESMNCCTQMLCMNLFCNCCGGGC